MDKLIVLSKLFFCSFRTFNFSRSVNRVNNHLFLFCSRSKVLVCVCDSFFHNRENLIFITSYLSEKAPVLYKNLVPTAHPQSTLKFYSIYANEDIKTIKYAINICKVCSK